jgi:hypothetical protein
MDNVLIFIVIAMIVLLPVMLFVQAQKRQDEQLSGILAKLSSMEGHSAPASPPPTDPYDLRRERSARIGELVMLEADLVRNGRGPTSDELNGVDAVRSAVKALNEQIAAAGDWKGPPYDLEWANIFDQFPTTKKAFISVENEPPPLA